MYDIIIIGAGPAGMTAAIYAKQARKNVLIIEKNVYGGQILKANIVKNYPGFNEITGFEFSNKLYNQMKSLNPDIKFEEVIKIENNIDFKTVITNKNSYKSKSVIIATGAESRKLGLNNEKEFLGKGISYCATCDGMFFKDKTVAILGGGVDAIDEALYLSDIAKKVYVIYRRKEFQFDSINLEHLRKKENVDFIFNSNIIDIKGNKKLESIIIKTIDEEIELNIDGLFIAIGHIPVSSLCNNLIDLDNKGYIISNEDCKTNIDGVFVAGDIRIKDIRQLTTACSDGTIAALNACKYLNINKNIEN